MSRARSRLIVMGVILLGSSGSGWAYDEKGDYTALGYGNVPCGERNVRRNGDKALAPDYQAWILGYISSFNRWVSNGSKNVAFADDPAALSRKIDMYCNTHPQDTLDTATEHLIVELSGRQ